MLGRDPVLDALDRWERSGLLDPSVAADLRSDALEEKERSGRRVSQYALAVAGGIVLLIALGVLADWLWPKISVGTQVVVLAVTGAVVYAGGLRVEGRNRWRPVAYALQTAGLLVVFWSTIYSGEAWPEGSPGAVAMGVVALLTPLVTGTLALRSNPVMPAVHVVLLPIFLAAFLVRALPISEDTVVWVLDGVMALVALVLVMNLRRGLLEGDPPERMDARLWSLTVALYVGLVLVFFTAAIPLDLGEETFWAADAWWVGMTALTLWATHRAPEPLRRDWYPGLLAVGLIMAIPFVLGTCLELLEWGSAPTAAVLGALGAAGIAYALEHRELLVLRTAALVVVVAAWYFGVEQAGALGAVGALAFTAVLLFWLSVRVGADGTSADGKPPPLEGDDAPPIP
jgi:hypothetical protein